MRVFNVFPFPGGCVLVQEMTYLSNFEYPSVSWKRYWCSWPFYCYWNYSTYRQLISYKVCPVAAHGNTLWEIGRSWLSLCLTQHYPIAKYFFLLFDPLWINQWTNLDRTDICVSYYTREILLWCCRCKWYGYPCFLNDDYCCRDRNWLWSGDG